MNKPTLLAAALWLALAGPAQAQALRANAAALPTTGAVRGAEHIVALVNSEPITSGDVRARLARVQPPEGGSLPPREELARQVLERLIVEKTQLQWAKEIGLKIEDSTVNDAEENVARQNGLTVPQLRERLTSLGLTPDGFRQNLRNELLLQRVREREVDNRVRVTEQEIDAYLREHAGGSTAADAVLHLAQILVAVPENASPAEVDRLRSRAEQFARRAQAGDDFATLAQAFSDGPEKQTGGQMGARPADRYPTLFVEATRALPVGGVTAPVRSGAGFHVLKVLDKRNPKLPDTHVTQTRARHILLRPSAQLPEAAALERLTAMRQQITSGQAKFEDLARAQSQDGSAAQGGDLGWAAPGQFVPEFEQVMNALAPGQVSEPLRSRFGLHLIEVVERRQAEVSRRDQREWVRNVLREEKIERAYDEWASDLRARAYVEYREPLQ